MKFVLDLMTKRSGRIGTLSKADFDVKTPLLLHYTKIGSIPHLSREVFDMLSNEKQGVQVSIETTSSLLEAAIQFQKGISAFCGLDHTFSFVTLKDTGATTQSFYSRDSVAISTRSGKESISPEKYMKIIETFKPDFFHTLCDGDTNEACGNKRLFNAVNRTSTFFRDCANLYEILPSLSDSMLIAPVEGGYSTQYRETSIKLLNEYENQNIIGGYFLDGFHSNSKSATDVDTIKVCDIVQTCTNHLPSNKLKIMLGAYSPTLLIQLIQLGVDVFDTTYVYLATSNNQALTFNFNVNHANQSSKFAIDLSDPIYKDKFEPYVENCKCLACQNHTRAYTQHLVNTKELLAPMLLMIHNTHHYLEFFKAIQQHITNDTLPTLLKLVSEQQSEYDAEKLVKETKRSDSDVISEISEDVDTSALKKLKTVA